MRKKIPSADVKAAREKLRSVDVKAARQRVQSTPRKPIGLGLGGIIGLAAVAFLAWRLLRGGGSAQSQPNWYYGDDRRDEVPNQ